MTFQSHPTQVFDAQPDAIPAYVWRRLIALALLVFWLGIAALVWWLA